MSSHPNIIVSQQRSVFRVYEISAGKFQFYEVNVITVGFGLRKTNAGKILYWNFDFYDGGFGFFEKAYLSVDWSSVFLGYPILALEKCFKSYHLSSSLPYRFMKVAGSTVDAVTWQQ